MNVIYLVPFKQVSCTSFQ